MAIEIKNWVAAHISERERTIITSIESQEFKSHPNEFKNVLLKEHKDAIRKLSFEYTRLLKQNAKLKEVIKSEEMFFFGFIFSIDMNFRCSISTGHRSLG